MHFTNEVLGASKSHVTIVIGDALSESMSLGTTLWGCNVTVSRYGIGTHAWASHQRLCPVALFSAKILWCSIKVERG